MAGDAVRQININIVHNSRQKELGSRRSQTLLKLDDATSTKIKFEMFTLRLKNRSFSK